MNNPPKIALMLPRFSRYGGVEQFGYNFAQALASEGFAVDFICGRQEAEAPPGVKVITVGRFGFARSVKMLWFLIRAEQARRKGNYDLSISLGKTWNQDLIRVGGGPLGIFWEKSEKALPEGSQRMLKRLSRKLSPSNWLTLLVEKRQYGKGNKIIAVSHLVRDWIKEAHPEADDVDVIYNRPNLERFQPPSATERQACRKALADRFNIPLPAPEEIGDKFEEPVFLGTATTNFILKGIGPLIDALAFLPPKVHFFIAGGRGSSSYMEQAKRLGLSERVHFCGKIDDMPSFLKAQDIFVLDTFYDACSNAVLEALASGCKTLTTASNGAAYFLPPEAIIADPSDVRELADKIGALLESSVTGNFVWPENIPAGIDFFVAKVKTILGRPI